MSDPRCYSKDPKIYLIRHGATALNKEGHHKGTDRIRGWQDIPLNDVGREDAKKIAAKLSKMDVSPEGIFCSDLGRAVETAKTINKIFRVPLQPSMAFRPWNLGVFQGEESSEVAPDIARLVYNPTIPVQDGEPFMGFVRRFIPALMTLLREIQSSHCDIVIVTHFRNFKLADAWVKAGMKSDLSFDPKTIIEDNVGTGEFTIVRPRSTNDTSPGKEVRSNRQSLGPDRGSSRPSH